MRRLAALIVVLPVLALAGPAGAGGVPPFPKLGGTWSHAEINVTIGKKPHTLILDRGVVRQETGTELTLREKGGGPLVVVPISRKTVVTLDGGRATIFSLTSGMSVVTMRIDGGVAVRVRAVV